ncbi:copia protein [Tanacetum coccineum]
MVELEKDEYNDVMAKIFDTIDDAYMFYNGYALLHGFGIRIHTTYKNKVTNEAYERKFVCNKEGFKDLKGKGPDGGNKKWRRDLQTGCEAFLRININKDKKWFVKEFKNAHNHELTATPTKVMKHRSHGKFHRSMACKSLMSELSHSGLTLVTLKRRESNIKGTAGGGGSGHKYGESKDYRHGKMQCLDAVEARRAAEEDEDFRTMNSLPVLSSINPIKAKAGASYTRKMFEVFKKEWILKFRLLLKVVPKKLRGSNLPWKHQKREDGDNFKEFGLYILYASRAVGYRFGPQLGDKVPVLIQYCMNASINDEELRFGKFSALDAPASKDKEVNMARDSDDALACYVENTVKDRIMDSGASFHATYCKEELERFKLRSGKVRLADNKTLDIAGVGDVILKISFGTSWTLKDVRWFGEAEEAFLHNVSKDKETAEYELRFGVAERLSRAFRAESMGIRTEALKMLKSTSGICTFMGCCLTSWLLKKQTALAISTTEVEYVSAEKASQQALWMKQALIDYDVRLDDIPIMCDNKGAIGLSKNLVQHSRTKHIEICHHFLRDNVQKGHISIIKVSSVDNSADILTKSLKRESFNYLLLGLGMMEHIP